MNKIKAIAILVIIVYVNNCFAQNTVSNKELHLVTTIQLPNVSGRIDHLAFDTKNQTIFVAALGNNTVEVVDLKSRKVIQTIKGQHEP
jgi:YVTN family beta-propeller protein